MKNYLIILLTLMSVSANGFAKAKSISLSEKINLVSNRIGFALRPREYDAILAGGESALKRWIELQMIPENIANNDVENLLAKHPLLTQSIEELQLNYSKDAAEDDPQKKPDEIRKAWSSAKLIRATLSPRQFEEKMVDFWYNHFNVDQRKGKNRWSFGPFERDAIRPHIFGKFADLLRATARHPAMLFYLDNHLSRADNKKEQKSGINENYARELMELHTLGVDGGYTQTDVKEVARILTGWSIEKLDDKPDFEFKDKIHDHDSKHVMTWDFPAGQGLSEGERLLDLLAQHPATAHRIAEKLSHYLISDQVPKKFIDHIAHVFTQSDGDLRVVYRSIIQSPEFWDAKYFNTGLKDNFTWLVSVIRTLDGEVLWNNQLVNEFNKLGEPLYQCAPPTGYLHRPENLINSGVLLARLNLALKLAANRIDGVYVTIPRPTDANLKSEGQVIRFLQSQLQLSQLTDSTQKAILSELQQENWKLNQGQIRPFILARLIGLLLASPEFQRM